MSVQLPLNRLLFLLAIWMLATAAACGLIYLDATGTSTLDSRPHRTHQPTPPIRVPAIR